MIIVRVRGGLGNQMFQFAAAKALAEHNNTACKLDLYYYTKHPFRKFELGKFNVPVEIASHREISRFIGGNKVIRFWNKYTNYLYCAEVCAQPHYHYYEDFFHLPPDIYLSGYWQSSRYFASIAPKLLDWYTPRQALDSKNQKLIDDIRNSASVSVHVRRGDYTGSTVFGFLPEDYYTKAIAYMKKQVPQAVFYIFSDDLSWCRANLSFENAVFVDYNKGADSYKDLLLMLSCKHNVIANSTFSWWGAWLNRNASKIVIAPRLWFNNQYNRNKTPVYPARVYNAKDLIPETWIRF